MPKSKKTCLVGHRGLPARYPENTKISLFNAIKHGVNGIEFDIQCSKEGTPYVFHDSTLKRLTGQSGFIYDLTDHELNQLSAYYPDRFGDQFLHNPLTTLEELSTELASFAPEDMLYFIEPKTESIERFGVKTVMDAILKASAPLAHQRFIISFHAGALAYVKNQLPTVWVLDDLSPQTAQQAIELAPDILCASTDQLSSGLPSWHTQVNAQWMVYSADDVDTLKAMQKLGIDYIETNDIIAISPNL